MTKYLQVQISAENQPQADKILNALLKKKLVTGGQILNSPARFLWKGEIVDMDYVTINSFTKEEKKEQIIECVREISEEEVPMVSFVAFEGNEELFSWIDATLA